ncbi:MAG: MBL fold metallo-hydrolase [Desulfobacteraceae bacterium]
MGGLQVIRTPGHTPGSICLYHAERQILFCGDALFNANPITGRPGLRFPIRIVTLDNTLAHDSVSRLSTLAVEALCCGHGDPILERAGEKKALLMMGKNNKVYNWVLVWIFISKTLLILQTLTGLLLSSTKPFLK